MAEELCLALRMLQVLSPADGTVGETFSFSGLVNIIETDGKGIFGVCLVCDMAGSSPYWRCGFRHLK